MNSLGSLIISILTIVTITGCAAPVQRSREVEEAKIYTLLLDSDPANYLSEASILVVGDSTILAGTGDDSDMSEFGRFLDKETVLDFQAVNQESSPMPASLPTKKPYALASDGELRSLPGNGDWPEFDAKFPNTGAVTFFSGIGFNKHLSRALVYMEHYCGGECASGNYYFLVRVGDTWKVKRIVESWVS